MDSPFLYPPAGYVVTCDLTCILDKGVRSLFKKGLNIDFHAELILLNAGILSRMRFRRTLNVGPKRKASKYMPLKTGTNVFTDH